MTTGYGRLQQLSRRAHRADVGRRRPRVTASIAHVFATTTDSRLLLRFDQAGFLIGTASGPTPGIHRRAKLFRIRHTPYHYISRWRHSIGRFPRRFSDRDSASQDERRHFAGRCRRYRRPEAHMHIELDFSFRSRTGRHSLFRQLMTGRAHWLRPLALLNLS